MSLRPLRKVKSGEWRSHDGRFVFVDGANYDNQGSNGLFWHVYEEGWEEPAIDRMPTLRDAVGEVAANYYDGQER